MTTSKISGNSHVSAALIMFARRLLTSAGNVEFLVNGKQAWVSGLLMNGPYLYVEIATGDNTKRLKFSFGVGGSPGSESAPSRKGSTRRKATKKGKKS